VDARFDKLEARSDKLEARFDKLEARFDKLEEQLQKLITILVTGSTPTTMTDVTEAISSSLVITLGVHLWNDVYISFILIWSIRRVS
jgi:predicted nuclease with TOPRIM domain